MFFDTVYKCDLHSITSDIIVYRDKSKIENIENAYTKVVAEIMVQKTFFPNIYKEIITGKLIHVYRTKHYIVYKYNDKKDTYKYDFDYVVPKVPAKTVFIKIFENSTHKYSDLKIAESCEIEKYIKENNNTNEYRRKLDEIFSKADEYYNNAYEQENYYYEKEKIKYLLKKNRK